MCAIIFIWFVYNYKFLNLCKIIDIVDKDKTYKPNISTTDVEKVENPGTDIADADRVGIPRLNAAEDLSTGTTDTNRVNKSHRDMGKA